MDRSRRTTRSTYGGSAAGGRGRATPTARGRGRATPNARGRGQATPATRGRGPTNSTGRGRGGVSPIAHDDTLDREPSVEPVDTTTPVDPITQVIANSVAPTTTIDPTAAYQAIQTLVGLFTGQQLVTKALTAERGIAEEKAAENQYKRYRSGQSSGSGYPSKRVQTLIHTNEGVREASRPCFKCGKPHAAAFRCDGSPRICFTCGQAGHISTYCRAQVGGRNQASQGHRQPVHGEYPPLKTFLHFLHIVIHGDLSTQTRIGHLACPHFPWLMLSESKHNQPTRAFFSFYKNKRHLVPLPESQGRRCWGSSCGWIFTIRLDLQMHLLNPVTRIRINLPPHSTFSQEFTLKLAAARDWYRTHFVRKAFVFKMSKRKGDILVMVTHGKNCCLAFARPGFSSWVTVESSTPYVFKDVTVFDGRIFAVCDSGALLIVEDIADGPSSAGSVREVASPPNGAMDWEKMYLVESYGELLLLCRRLARSIIDFSLETVSF
ncbi:hypothetical protein Vadar_012361 [Vaccinium darrowii]|uniref:Uncharacterized protein n=1 Tax=Vaccinium darrowii TaxID=229202 RepID=A0ACB7XQ94_9ERIC|nr:hypothetical protein Vadar_012361 [Vaccinium darrowii]